jgi:Kef-type K+ transport system membrane component KefB
MRVEMNERHWFSREDAVFSAPVQWLSRAPLDARATIALGFLILAAHLGGTVAQRWRLPRVTGYLLAGLIVGPAWLDFVRATDLAALQLFATGALVLIAFGAGLALRIPASTPERFELLRIAGSAIVPPFVIVTLVFLSVTPWFPLTTHQPFRDKLTIALILGAFAAVASPLLTHAVRVDSGDTSTRGQRILAVTAVQDAAALLLIVLLLAVAQPLSSWGATRPGIAWDSGLGLFGSLLIGGLLAVLLARYVRSVTRHLVLMLVGFAALIVLAAWQLGLEPVLLGFGAGMALRLAFPVEAERLEPVVKMCAEPVHIVFFGLAGAALSFGALAELWPWAMLLVGLRLAGLRAGLRWSGLPNDWLGLVSQGGLALALAAVVRRAFPEWNVSLEALLVAMIGVYQLAGPICFQWVLKRPQEGVEVAHASDRRVAVESASVPGSAGGGGM